MEKKELMMKTKYFFRFIPDEIYVKAYFKKTRNIK